MLCTYAPLDTGPCWPVFGEWTDESNKSRDAIFYFSMRSLRGDGDFHDKGKKKKIPPETKKWGSGEADLARQSQVRESEERKKGRKPSPAPPGQLERWGAQGRWQLSLFCLCLYVAFLPRL